MAEVDDLFKTKIFVVVDVTLSQHLQYHTFLNTSLVAFYTVCEKFLCIKKCFLCVRRFKLFLLLNNILLKNSTNDGFVLLIIIKVLNNSNDDFFFVFNYYLLE